MCGGGGGGGGGGGDIVRPVARVVEVGPRPVRGARLEAVLGRGLGRVRGAGRVGGLLARLLHAEGLVALQPQLRDEVPAVKVVAAVHADVERLREHPATAHADLE